ncbi:aminotransferase class IV [Gracilimonas sp. BCB1]|uniref:aminotransferase class IV n=1 Tax=Gracilimonas sp. BCB1 TaxID=3152362 RepID=UPI0032D8E651
MSKSVYMILNGELIPESAAAISPLNRGLMYGDGCFETLRSYSGKFLGWNDHIDRLSAGLDYLNIQAPFSSKELKEQVEKLLKQNQLKHAEAMIRIQCWRNGGRGYTPSSKNAQWMIQASKQQTERKDLKLSIAQTRCIPSEALERKHKLSNGLNYIKAAQEAAKRSCDDALMFTVDDKVSETTSANIFWIKEDKVYTPSTKCDLLPGVTRLLVLDVIRSLGLEFEESEYLLSDIRQAEAVFCTNSLMEIAEVLSLDEIRFEVNHPLVMKIKAGFDQMKVKEFQQ